MSTNEDQSLKAPFAGHREFVSVLKDHAPLGNAALRAKLNWQQPGRFRRVRNTLIGLQVVRFEGGRGASARLALGAQNFDDAIAAGMDVHAGREIDVYPLLTDPIDRMITGLYTQRDLRISQDDEGDGITPYITASKRAGTSAGAYTRPDITVLVDLHFDHLGPWNDVHSIEVKPYWSVGRDGLFEAAAQAALRRCTHSWLLVYLPPADAPGMLADQRSAIKEATRLLWKLRGDGENDLGELSAEAASIGIGVAVASSLLDAAELEVIVEPARQVMDPVRAEELFESLHRGDGRRPDSDPD